MAEDAFIRFENVTKTFGGVTALDAVTLSIAKGECHALMGENGAGKSTLGKILAGIHRPDSGADLDVARPMAELSTAQEQLVQIASAVGTGAGVLVFDEPTSSLSEHD